MIKINEQGNYMEESLSNSQEVQQESTDIKQPNWANRRFMAYLSLFSIIGLCLATIVLGIISIKILEAMIPIISVFVMAFGSIVGAYMGFATYSDKWLINKQ